MKSQKTNKQQAILLTRVSTEEQGQSRNGLEAQKANLLQFCKQNDIEIIKHYEEISSGKYFDIKDRPVLGQAIEAARKAKAILLVAKIDRLSRDVELIAHLMNRGVRFASVEAGLNASAFEIQLRATFAAEERRKISERTREALQALKKTGKKLGNPKQGQDLIDMREAQVVKANIFAEQKEEYIRHLRMKGCSFAVIAMKLNQDGVTTARGKRWYPTTVKNLLDRADGLRDKKEKKNAPAIA